MAEKRVPQSGKIALRERIKELTCLYDIAQIASQPDQSLESILQGIAEVLPSAWQRPELTSARIVLEGVSYKSGNFPDNCQRQCADILVNGQRTGFIEIGYAGQALGRNENAFLDEEKNLLNEIAWQTGFIIERNRAEQDKLKLQDQLRHADRLATVGMLAAGIAHELNEPLGNILGFAQLAKKCPEMPDLARKDVEKIETASLHAREIIQKLLVFSGQVQAERNRVNLNEVVEDGLYFFKARCAKQGIELTCNLCDNPPDIFANAVQLNQVLVNLVVNALQSMSGPGKITVETRARDHNACLVVEDTGPGIAQDVLDKIFVPFFTTKDVGQGTGLGLPVVHGIVTAYDGSINIESEIGKGTRFEIEIPINPEPSVKETN